MTQPKLTDYITIKISISISYFFLPFKGGLLDLETRGNCFTFALVDRVINHETLELLVSAFIVTWKMPELEFRPRWKCR